MAEGRLHARRWAGTRGRGDLCEFKGWIGTYPWGLGLSSWGAGDSSQGSGLSSQGPGLSSWGSGLSSRGSGLSSRGSGDSSQRSGLSSQGLSDPAWRGVFGQADQAEISVGRGTLAGSPVSARKRYCRGNALHHVRYFPPTLFPRGRVRHLARALTLTLGHPL